MTLKRRRVLRHPAKRRRVLSPQLPMDVWHAIASHLAPQSLAALSSTSKELFMVAQPIIWNSLWHAIFDAPPPLDVDALAKVINLLNTAPSLRSKNISRQVRLACEKVAHTPDPYSCFTVDQAVAFLNVDKQLLISRYSPARVKTTRRAVKRGYTLAFEPFPPDIPPRTELPTRVFGVREVIRAAYATHGDLRSCLSFVEGAVRRDFIRFERAKKAEAAVCGIACEKFLEVKDVEYALNASTAVTEFRRGLWILGYEEYCRLVRQMIEVHVGLGSCYKCLLNCDGNARLKAKRIVGKMLRNGENFHVCDVVRVLEGKLWWARSKSNVEKMEQMTHYKASMASSNYFQKK